MTEDREAIILVDHGSRAEAANETLEALAELLRGTCPDRLVIVAHMELAPPTLAEAFERCAGQGVQRITVMPYFLGPGRHTTRDIPALVQGTLPQHRVTKLSPRPADAAQCPWLERGLCGNREGRALACRTYFCSDEAAAAEVTATGRSTTSDTTSGSTTAAQQGRQKARQPRRAGEAPIPHTRS